MPKRKKNPMGGLTRREAEKAILFLRCLDPEILTLPPRELFDIKKWSVMNGFSKKGYHKSGHSNWCYLRNKILKLQRDDANATETNDQEIHSASSTVRDEIVVATRSKNIKGKGRKIVTELTKPVLQDLDDDDEPVVGNITMAERVIEFVDPEPIEIKDEDQFEVDWRGLKLHQQRLDSPGPEPMES